VRGKLDAEQIAHLAVEVGETGLRPADDADLGVSLRTKPLGEDAQRDRLAGAGRAGDEREAALAGDLWGIYQLLGKLCPTVYRLRKP